MPKVNLTATLRQFAGQQSVIELDGLTVNELIRQLIARFPALESHLLDDTGKLHSHVNLFVDHQSIRDAAGIETPVGPGQTLLIHTALSGG